MNQFGKRVRKLRRENRWTQQEIADQLGVSKSSISMYENGKREPDFELMERIADLFNVDMDYLYGKPETRNRYRQSWKESAPMYGRRVLYRDELFEITAKRRTLKPGVEEDLRKQLLQWTQEE